MSWQSMKEEIQTLNELEAHDEFHARHMGPNGEEKAAMLRLIGQASLEELTDAIVPASIKLKSGLALPVAVSEEQALDKIRAIAQQNQVYKSFIGQGYYGTHTPKVILRNILENPAWYTAYTPYQAEISQGRLEALINFQTMVCDLTGMEISNASLLDEATAAAEAMTLAKRTAKNKSTLFLLDEDCHPQTLAVVQTRAEALGLHVGHDRLFWRTGAIPVQSWQFAALGSRSEPGTCQGCAVLCGDGFTGTDPAQAPWGMGSRYCRGQYPAFWCAVWFWRPACRLSGLS
jgi:glycine cleavage system pyridoxal-binding protein P